MVTGMIKVKSQSETVRHMSTQPLKCPRSLLSFSIITDRPLYMVIDCRQPSFLGRCSPCLERTATPCHVCTVSSGEFSSVVSRLIYSAIPFPTFCKVICVVIGGHFSHFCYLLAYLFARRFWFDPGDGADRKPACSRRDLRQALSANDRRHRSKVQY